MQQQEITFEGYAAERLAQEAPELMTAWLARLSEQRGGRTDAPLLHLAAQMPQVLRLVGEVVAGQQLERLRQDPDVADSLLTLARVRHASGCTPSDLIHEFEVLAEVLDEACRDWLRQYDDMPPLQSLIGVVGRLNRAPLVLCEILVAAYWVEVATGSQLPRVREFADLVSHELNTPLNAASVTAQLLEYVNGNGQPKESQRLAALITRNLQRADAVLRDVRTAALGIASTESVRRVLFGQVLGEALAETRQEAMQAGVRIDVDEPVPGVRVDGPRVRLVLSSLIRNAIRYSDPARHTRWVRIQCEYAAEDRAWWVCVSDNGLGIPHELKGEVFQRVFRAHRDRTTGTGLGLMIARQEVEQLGGRIAFTSTAGAGSTFRFSVPESEGKWRSPPS